MSSHRITPTIAVGFAVAALALAGCVPPAVSSSPSVTQPAESTQTTATHQTSAEPTGSSQINAAGPIANHRQVRRSARSSSTLHERSWGAIPSSTSISSTCRVTPRWLTSNR